MTRRSFSREEVDEILRRAAERSVREEGQLELSELQEIAREVGLDAEEIERAAQELEAERTHAGPLGVRGERAVVAEWQVQRRARAVAHVKLFVGTLGSLVLLDQLLLRSGQWTVLACYLGVLWGLCLWWHWRAAHRAPTEAQRAAVIQRATRQHQRRERAREKATARAERAARRERRKDAAREFERAVEDGVTDLLGAAARRIDLVRGGAPSDGARREAQTARGPRIQVETPRDGRHEASEPDAAPSEGAAAPAARRR